MYTYCGTQLAAVPQLCAATVPEYIPAGQAVHTDDNAAPTVVENMLAAQPVHKPDPAATLYAPAGQLMQAVDSP